MEEKTERAFGKARLAGTEMMREFTLTNLLTTLAVVLSIGVSPWYLILWGVTFAASLYVMYLDGHRIYLEGRLDEITERPLPVELEQMFDAYNRAFDEAIKEFEEVEAEAWERIQNEAMEDE